MNKLFILILIFLFGCTTCSSCKGIGIHLPFTKTPEIGIEKPLPKIEKPQSDSNKDKLFYETACIREYADLDNDHYDTPEKFDKILGCATNINVIAKEVDQTEINYKKQYEELKNSDEVQTRKIWLWVIGVSSLFIIAGAAVACLANTKMGISLGLSGILISAAGYMMLKISWIFPVIGMIVIIGVAIILVMELIKNKQALVDVVKSFEIVKEKSFKDVKQDIKIIQSPATRNVVAQIKDKLEITGEPDVKTEK